MNNKDYRTLNQGELIQENDEIKFSYNDYWQRINVIIGEKVGDAEIRRPLQDDKDEILHVIGQDKPVDDLTKLVRLIDNFPAPDIDMFDHSHLAPEGYCYELCHAGWLLLDRKTREIVLTHKGWLAKRQELDQKSEQIVDGSDISQSDADEVSDIVIPTSEANECKNPDKSNCKYCSSKYRSVCKVIENNDLADVNDTDVVETANGVKYGIYNGGMLDATSRENEFDSIAGQVGMLKGRPVTDEEWIVGEKAIIKDGTILKYGNDHIGQELEIVALLPEEDSLVLRLDWGLGCFSTHVLNHPITPAQIAEEERKAVKENLRQVLSGEGWGYDYTILLDKIYDWHIAQGEGK